MPIQVRDGRQVSLEGGIQVVTSPERTTTTIVDNGRVVTVTTQAGGGLPVVTLNGHETRDPRVLTSAIERVATAASRQPPRVIREASTVRVNGRALSQKELVAASAAAGGAATFVALVLLYATGRLLLRLVRRRPVPNAPAAPLPNVAPRIERIEQAIEGIALEVERVAEAQRYSAKLLTERLPDAQASTARRAPAPERVATPH